MILRAKTTVGGVSAARLAWAKFAPNILELSMAITLFYYINRVKKHEGEGCNNTFIVARILETD